MSGGDKGMSVMIEVTFLSGLIVVRAQILNALVSSCSRENYLEWQVSGTHPVHSPVLKLKNFYLIAFSCF